MIIDRFEYNGAVYVNYDTTANPKNIPSDVLQGILMDAAWELVRKKRDSLLRTSDYAVMPDYPLTEAQQADVTAYRQALRDIPETFASPDAVEWPAKPEALA